MPLLILGLFFALVLGPQLWARAVLARYAAVRDDIPGSGAEFACHLLRRAGLGEYAVEAATGGTGDHFDPQRRCVVLAAPHHDGRSLAAMVVAAHEVGHAIQHYIGYRPLFVRQRLARFAVGLERWGAIVLVAMPFVTVMTRSPAAGALLLLVGGAVMLVPVAVHLVTLPVEFDASFARALPILERGYLGPADLPAARRILTACALTYVAGALVSVLNFRRWIRLLRH
ncbi:MAG: zinc metallopeptidase [Gammaproteobacteria bacterium]|nr:zinc metallopeptidase [Gammaproteobacteria bacterium]